MGDLFTELKRRNVFKVAVAYLVVGWLTVQVVSSLSPMLELPDVFGKMIVVALLVGFPVALLFAWAFELTPDGIKKSKDVDTDKAITHKASRKIVFIIIGALVLIIGGLGFERMTNAPTVDHQVSEESQPAQRRPSIAVLPFADMSPENNQVYFSDGISDEILNVLAQVKGLHVTSRSSAFQFRGNDIHIPTVGETLGVDHVLEGSVRKSGNSIRITAQLIEAASDKHLWSATFDRALTTENIFAIQSDIANAIVTEMGDELGIADGVAPITVAVTTADLSTYEAFLKGRDLFLNRSSPQQVIDSVEILERVTHAEPAFAEAWLWLGAAYSIAPAWLKESNITTIDYSDYLERAIEAANKALTLDPDLSFAHTIIANAGRLYSDVNYVEIIDLFKTAVALSPNNATTHHWLAITYRDLGFFDLSTTHFDRCLSISPLYLNCMSHKAVVEEYMGNTTNAEVLLEKMHALAPASPYYTGGNTFVFLSPRLIRQGQTLAARIIIQSSAKNVEAFPVDGWIDAIQNPSGNHDATLRRIYAWAETIDLFKFDQGLLYLSIGAWDRVPLYEQIDVNPPLWYPEHVGYRQSENFKANIRNLNIDDYWRERGFPPQCRAKGEDDFVCD